MKTGILSAVFLAILLGGCETAGRFGDILTPAQLPQSGQLTTAEIDAGLREALNLAATHVATRLGETNGYFGDPKVRIPLPKTYRDVQKNLAVIGASGPLDEVELRMNRAAEAAVPEARALIISAVQGMTIEDAYSILGGGDTAATDFLRKRTQAQLTASFTPHMRKALAESGAFSALERFAGGVGLGGATSSLQADLTSHAVRLGLDGVFLYMAEEEQKIRETPLARSTDLLRKVFGASV